MKARHSHHSNFIKKYFSKVYSSKYKELFQDLPLPQMLEIEPINTCNLRCRMCHFSFINQKKVQYIDSRLIKKLNSVKGIWVKIGSNFEPVMHPKFIDMIQMLSEMDCKIDLTTNGTLLTKKTTNQIADSNIRNITVSFDSVKKQTYEKIRRKAKFEPAIERLTYFREKLSNERIFFAINAVLCRSNIDEVIDMIKYWDAKDIHQLRLIFMVVRSLTNDFMGENDLLNESLYPIRTSAFEKLDKAAEYIIRNKLKITLSSPYFNESKLRSVYPNHVIGNLVRSDNSLARDYFNPGHHYQRGSYPGMHFDCLSPFVFARILYNGDVDLCYQCTIGNLNFQGFENIWHGKKAHRWRQRIISDTSICNKCDYFRFCISSSTIDINDKKNYFQQNLIDESKTIWEDYNTINS